MLSLSRDVLAYMYQWLRPCDIAALVTQTKPLFRAMVHFLRTKNYDHDFAAGFLQKYDAPMWIIDIIAGKVDVADLWDMVCCNGTLLAIQKLQTYVSDIIGCVDRGFTLCCHHERYACVQWMCSSLQLDQSKLDVQCILACHYNDERLFTIIERHVTMRDTLALRCIYQLTHERSDPSLHIARVLLASCSLTACQNQIIRIAIGNKCVRLVKLILQDMRMLARGPWQHVHIHADTPPAIVKMYHDHTRRVDACYRKGLR